MAANGREWEIRVPLCEAVAEFPSTGMITAVVEVGAHVRHFTGRRHRGMARFGVFLPLNRCFLS